MPEARGWGAARASSKAMMTPNSKRSIWDAVAASPASNAVEAFGAPLEEERAASDDVVRMRAGPSPRSLDLLYAQVDTNRSSRLEELRNARRKADAIVQRSRSGGSDADEASPPVPVPVSPEDGNALAPASTPSPQTSTPPPAGGSGGWRGDASGARLEELEKSLRHEETARSMMAEAQQVTLQQLETANTRCSDLEAALREARETGAERLSEITALKARLDELEGASRSSESRAVAAEERAAKVEVNCQRLEGRCRRLEEQRSPGTAEDTDQRCRELEQELTAVKTAAEESAAAERSRWEQSERAMEKLVTELASKNAALSQAEERLRQSAPPNLHFERWKAMQQLEEEQCLVRKL